jgi:hypothetical protein
MITIMGINDISALPALSIDDINFINGVTTDFLHSNEAYIIAQKDFLQENSISIGDKVALSLYSFDIGIYPNTTVYRKLAIIDVDVAGSFTSLAQASGTAIPNIICPISLVEDIHSKSDLPFFADSATFAVSDPLNLNDFKSAMKEVGLLSVNSQDNDFSISG